MLMVPKLIAKSVFNKEDLKKSKLCGCFYCCEIFSPKEITEWTDDGKTAICPKCKVDSILPLKENDDDSKEILEKMYGYYFL